MEDFQLLSCNCKIKQKIQGRGVSSKFNSLPHCEATKSGRLPVGEFIKGKAGGRTPCKMLALERREFIARTRRTNVLFSKNKGAYQRRGCAASRDQRVRIFSLPSICLTGGGSGGGCLSMTTTTMTIAGWLKKGLSV